MSQSSEFWREIIPGRFLVAAAGQATRAVRTRLYRSGVHRVLVGGPIPARVIAPPPSIVPGLPARAGEFYRGVITLGGITLGVGANSPFKIATSDEAWLEELAAFTWLRHLDAAQTAIAAAHGRACVADWIEVHGRWHELSWRPVIVARRVMAWLTHSRMLLDGANEAFRATFMASLGRQIRFLQLAADGGRDEVERIVVRAAIAQACLSLDDCERWRPRAIDALCRRLERFVSPDGGTLDRSPQTVLELLQLLVPLRRTFTDCDMEVPHALLCAVDRMVPMLRMLSHGDGGLALFNGTDGLYRDEVAAIVAGDASRALPLTHARHSGYNRMVRGATTVIVDTGCAPPPGYRDRSHAGCLAFEMSDGRNRVITNCGALLRASPRWRELARTTAAHSTASINERSIGEHRPWPFGSRARGIDRGPRTVAVEREEDPAGSILKARHDGYRRRFGLIHARSLYLDTSGEDMRGEDSFTRCRRRFALRARRPDLFTLRFHLHPDVRATMAQDGRSVLLLLPDHSGWRFTAQGGELAVEDGVYLADGDEPRATLQIVVVGTVERRAVVKWALKKQPRPPAGRPVSDEEAPGLPLEPAG